MRTPFGMFLGDEPHLLSPTTGKQNQEALRLKLDLKMQPYSAAKETNPNNGYGAETVTYLNPLYASNCRMR
jgi:hypothetical protein